MTRYALAGMPAAFLDRSTFVAGLPSLGARAGSALCGGGPVNWLMAHRNGRIAGHDAATRGSANPRRGQRRPNLDRGALDSVRDRRCGSVLDGPAVMTARVGELDRRIEPSELDTLFASRRRCSW